MRVLCSPWKDLEAPSVRSAAGGSPFDPGEDEQA